jgi:DNA/RNA-binding domain of Phe-tRNA-synthetase-like protein
VTRCNSRLEVLKKIYGQHILRSEPEYNRSNEIWFDYQRTYEVIDPNYECFVPLSKYLIFHFLDKRRFGITNTFTDICNLVSMSSLLSVISHNQPSVEGQFRVGITTGSEMFIPTGLNTPMSIGPGEYAHMDNYNVLCRLDVRQAQKTMVTLETQNTIIAIHGNRVTSGQYMLDAAQQMIDLIHEFCGGECQLVCENNLVSPIQ